MICDILYRNLIGANPFCIRFYKADGFVGAYDRSRYSVLLGPEIYDAIYNTIRYLIIKIGFYGSLGLEKALTEQSVKILIKPLFNKDQNHYYFNIFLEKCSYQLSKK